MRRRSFAVLAAAAGWARPAGVAAQEPRRLRGVGVMARPAFQLDALKDGLRELGYHDGVNIALHRPSAAIGSPEQLAANAAALVRLGIEVIVAGGSESVQAAKAATSSIPIVMTLVGDPVDQGFVRSLSRPGGNVTGLSNLSLELAGKWVEILKEVEPRLRRIVMLRNPQHPGHRPWLAGLQQAAAARGIELEPLDVERAEDLGRIADARRAPATGVVVPGSTLHLDNLARIAELAAKSAVPSVAWTAAFVASGGLMAYGASETAQFRRAAVYVDKILKGAQAADLPIEQPTRFELSLNMRTARMLGLAIPPAVLSRAEEVVD